MQNETTEYTALLQKLKIKALNPMQLDTIATTKTNNEVILLSNTGTGKTLAFLLSVLDKVQNSNKNTVVLIVAPSRELAIQIEVVYKSLGVFEKITCCYGGHKREIEENNLVESPAIIVGTPGRLADHIRRGNIKTATIKTLILDEFDKLLELNFGDEMAFIYESLTGLEQKILTSATELKYYPDFLHFNDCITLNHLTEEQSVALAIEVMKCKDKDKLAEAFGLLCKIGARSTIIFCNHRESVKRVSDYLTDKGIDNQSYHGAMEQRERDNALCKFRNGTVDFLVTTDLASRGLDIPNIRNIIHYHLPTTEEVFTHRNGRTARMDASGTAIVLLSPEETLPTYVDNYTTIELPTNLVLPTKPAWTTLYLDAGKKDKINKIDIVGFLSNRGKLKKEEIGVIEVKDFISFVAVKKTMVGMALQNIKDLKIKNKKVLISVAK
jgi:superfamily II DNA/RNA helicase